jgi:hypothetical protein
MINLMKKKEIYIMIIKEELTNLCRNLNKFIAINILLTYNKLRREKKLMAQH